jgi:hypothetical protein
VALLGVALRFSDPFDPDQPDVVWDSVLDLAESYWAEDDGTLGPAHDFVQEQMFGGTDLAIEVLNSLVATASSAEQVVFVGCGPMEDLMSHGGNGGRFLDSLERHAKADERFGLAASSMWLGANIPGDVRRRLVALGATDVSRAQG